jgi:membrane protease YdiL (CAAX protease family)
MVGRPSPPSHPWFNEVTFMKKAAFFLAEVLGYTLLIQAIGGLLFRIPSRDFVWLLGIWFLFGLAVLVVSWVFNKVFRGQGFRELGLRCHKSFAADIWLGVCGFAVIDLLSLPFDFAAMPDRANMAHAILAQLHFSSPLRILVGGSVFAMALGLFTGAFHEEVRFRGYYQGAGAAELTPLAGFIIALVPFSLGHYFAQTQWSSAQVLATIISGIVFGLLYYATGSLIVVITAHTLANWLPFHPFLLGEMTGSRTVTIMAILALALLSLLLIVLRWNRELREWRLAARRLFSDQPVFGIVAGLIIGSALLALWPHRFAPLYSALAGSAVAVIAFVGKRTPRRTDAIEG